MADAKWTDNSQFPVGSSLANTDYLMGLKSGGNEKWTYQTLLNQLQTDIIVTGLWGEMYFSSNAVNTTFVSVGVPEKVVGTYVSGSLQGFSQASGTLTYNNPTSNIFQLIVSMTASAEIDPVNLTFLVYVNGSASSNIKQSIDFDGVLPSQMSVSLSGIVVLANTFTVQVFVQNNTDTTPVLVQNFNCSLISVLGSASTSGQVVTSWNGSTSPVAVTAGTGINIAAGQISYTGNSTPTYQDVYDNTTPAQTALIGGKPYYFTSTTEGVRVPSMTQAQSSSIVSPLNGLEVWQNDTNRKAINSGTPGAPNWKQIAWTSDIGGMATLQSAYDNGNGVIIISGAKPVVVQSSTSSIIPQISTWQTDMSNLANPIGIYSNIGKNSIGNNITYSSAQTVVLSTTSGAERSKVNRYAMKNGTFWLYQSYDGTADYYNINAGTTFVSNLLNIGPSNAGANYTLGTSVNPQTTYTAAAGYILMWISFNGTNTVVPNSFAIGNTIEMDMTGFVNVNMPNANADGGSRIQVQFGTAFTATSSAIAVGNTTTRTRPWQLKIKITRINNQNVIASACGFYFDNSNVCQPITLFINPPANSYNAGASNDLTIKFANNNSAGNTFAFVAQNLDIRQFS